MTLFSAPTLWFGGVHRTALVISFTLRLENFLNSIEALAKLDNLRESLGSGVEPLDDELFLSLLR